MPQKSKNGVAFFERGSWYHRTRYYDEDYIIKYGKKGGFKTQEEAEKSYYKHRADFETVQQKLWRKKDTSIEFRQYLQTWLNQQTQFQSNTRNVYRCVLGQALPHMPEIKLCAVNENYINSIIRIISAQTKSYGLKLYELFSMALADAYSESLIDYNPMVDCKRPKREIVELNILTKEQKQRFMQYAKYNKWYLEILLCMFCGLKRGEVYALRFDDFNVEKKTVSIHNQVVGEYVQGKSGKTTCRPIERQIDRPRAVRVLQVPDVVMIEVEKRRIMNQERAFLYGSGYKDKGLICCQENGDYRSLSAMSMSLKALCKKVGVPNVSPQNLRDMYAEMMLKSENVSLLELTALLGYDSIDETCERYADLVERDFGHNQYIDQMFLESKNECNH